MKKHTSNQLVRLGKLLRYTDVYDINIQFWNQQVTVFISKDGVELKDYGGDFDFSIDRSLKYLIRITKKQTQ